MWLENDLEGMFNTQRAGRQVRLKVFWLPSFPNPDNDLPYILAETHKIARSAVWTDNNGQYKNHQQRDSGEIPTMCNSRTIAQIDCDKLNHTNSTTELWTL